MNTSVILQSIFLTVIGGLFLWALQRIVSGFDKTLDKHSELIERLFAAVEGINSKFHELLGEHKRNHK